MTAANFGLATIEIQADAMKDCFVFIQPTFLTVDDEQLLIDRVRHLYEDLVVIDGTRWPEETPPSRQLANECEEWALLFWVPRLWPKLPAERLPVKVGNKFFQGPQNAYVVRLERSRLKDGVLLSGQLDASIFVSNVEIVEFAKAVRREARKLNTSKLICASTNSLVGKYIVGPQAAHLNKHGMLLKHNCADVFYRSK